MLTMAKKPRTESADAGEFVRPKLFGALAECVRFEGKMKGLVKDTEIIRFILTDRYTQLGWLAPGADGELEFRRPEPPQPR